jgi:hypothetical protein
MSKAIRWGRWLLAATAVACAGGEETPRKDTVPADTSPAVPRRPVASGAWRWESRAGTIFLVSTGTDEIGRLIRPTYTADQILDTLDMVDPAVVNTDFDLISGGSVVGIGRASDARTDSTCVGWPTVRVASAEPWRVAFPTGRVEPVAFDSLPAWSPRDSARVTTIGARAASRLPGDTASAFRGRPFVVRQAIRFGTGGGSSAILFEIVRLVPQEANPLQEQIVMIVEDRPPDANGPDAVFYARTIGLEESLSSIDLLAVVRVTASGRMALLLRRDREGGFLLQWIDRDASGRWTVTWESAIDSC